MTIAPENAAAEEKPPVPEGMVRCTIDGFEVVVPKDTLIIRAAEQLGIAIPRFCDHPLLDPVGACRQCIVEVEGQRKPVASCTVPVTDGMEVKTQLTSAVAEKAQAGTMEMLLINHPLDCPVCDKGGECPLQNQAMANGRGETRFHEEKRTFEKPVPISSQVLLDRERCVLCARCTRFSQQIAGDPFIELFERGALQQVGIDPHTPFQSYFSGNTVQICPVGALTGASYRFRARPFDLVSETTACEHCASGCELRTDFRRGAVQRRLAGNDPDVNEEWSCDKGRWAFRYGDAPERLTTPLVRDVDSGELVAGSWSGAIELAGARVAAARTAAVLAGGRLTVEDAYAWGKLARLVLGTNDVDMRARPHSAEEAEFLAHAIGFTSPYSTDDTGKTTAVTYADLEKAPAVVLAGIDPEEESPIVFLRLRKAARHHGLQVLGVQPFETPALKKCNGTLVATAPGSEAAALASSDVREALAKPGAVLVVGERLASSPGALTAALTACRETGARVAWIPRRAGERGALYAGLFPSLLPGARPVDDATARGEVAAAWGVDADRIPTAPGRDTAGILELAASGSLDVLFVVGVDLDDLPDPAAARAALEKVGTVIVLDPLRTELVERAHIAFGTAVDAEREGSYADWEGRVRRFGKVLDRADAVTDGRVAHLIAAELGVDLKVPTPGAARAEIQTLHSWKGTPPPAPSVTAPAAPAPGEGEAVLATWHRLLDDGTLQQREPHLAGTQRASVARVSAATAAALELTDGQALAVSTDGGTVTLPLVITAMPDGVVWLPTKSAGSHVRATLRATEGAVVKIARGAEVGA
ncbi:MAG TPA: NADH-quinone oxidoreductase subunit G [Mycobacteriales bacterium]|nr:NADH-quinone oxidoreductase subunit G [Mycobacteriales bacterium]